MGWVERIYGTEEPRISVHHLCASVAEAKRGLVTAQEVQADFGLTQQDRTEIAQLVLSSMTAREIEDVLCRAEYVSSTIPGGRLTGCASAAAVRTRLGL